MISSMRHRGPDDQGIYQDNQVALGMTRLAVIDVHPSGHQPMSTPDGNIWIVYNGEIYNFKQERQILESHGYSFRSTSDTEVVLRMYEHYGDDFLIRLRGIFALAIYDKRKGIGRERLLLARDQFGIKPLLYSESGETFVFGSEIKAMLASGLVSAEINPAGMRLLLTFGSVYQPDTILEKVRMLLPAHRLILENGKEKRIERYWSLGIDRVLGVRALPYEKQVALLDSTLRETVRMQMVSDVPLGAFLSGGVDSSILVALMAKVADHKIKTFSVGFESEGADIDESEDAKKTAHYIGTDHSHVLVKGSDVCTNIRHIASGLDQPSVDGVNTYFVSLAARKEVTVAISGTGGDEIFAGYPWFISMAKYQRSLQQSPGTIQRQVQSIKQFTRQLRNLGIHKNNPEKKSDCDQDGFLTHFASNYNIFGSEGASRIIDRNLMKNTQAGQAECVDLQRIDELSQGSAIERVSGLVLRGYTCNQLLRDIDAVSMSHSLEVRVPYLDPVIADLALSLPDTAKLGNPGKNSQASSTTYRSSGAKRILIDVGRTFLPKDFDIQPKRGFSMPFDAWLRGPLNGVLEDTLSVNSVQSRGWLKVSEVKKIKRHFYGKKTGWPQPWLMMMIELWGREVMDSRSEL
jgi:asparagine synthase (glutamine-hydrolysing)